MKSADHETFSTTVAMKQAARKVGIIIERVLACYTFPKERLIHIRTKSIIAGLNQGIYHRAV